MGNPPLHGIRILDMSRVLAGPWAGQYLADLGAEVIKVERAGSGDDARFYGGPYVADAEGKDTSENFFHLSCNRGKKSLTVDISCPEGQEIVRRLAATCDVFIENFKVGDLARYGLDYATLHEQMPQLIYCSITGFGQTGPYRHRPGYDAVFQGMSGLMSVTGYPDTEPGGGPMKVGPSITDIICGLNAVIGITSALYARDVRGGVGQEVDIALFDTGVAAMSHYAQIYLTSGMVPTRRGTQGNGGVPSQMFRASDGEFMLTSGNDMQFRRLCDAIGLDWMPKDPRFSEGRIRITNRDALREILEAHFLTGTVAQWLAALEKAGVPSGPIYNFQQVFDDPQIKDRGLEVRAPHPLGPDISMIGSPLKLSETPVAAPVAPPLLGQHTDDILRDLGFDAETLADLRSRNII